MHTESKRITKNKLFLINITDKKLPPHSKDKTATTKFQTTPILPTYLVGFVISDFESHELIRKNFKQHYFARPNAMNSIQFSETYGADILQHFMDKFTTAPLPLEVMKQIPLPDFHFGGMENFGMVTYRESKLLVDPELDVARQILNIMNLMGHEMAHSWFGNLVTMDWWTCVWMKEGFSTMYSYYGADEVSFIFIAVVVCFYNYGSTVGYKSIHLRYIRYTLIS